MTPDFRKPLGLDDVLIVDCDVHANEPPEALAPYIDMPWRRSLELLGRGPQRYLDIPATRPSSTSIRHSPTAGSATAP